MKNEIIELYTKNNKSLSFIATKFSIGRFVVKKILKENNVLIRSAGATISLKNQFQINDYINDVIIGELLGDGSIYKSGSTSGGFTYSTSRKEYLIWLYLTIFANNGISIMREGIKECISKPSHKSLIRIPTVSYKARTLSYLQFGVYRKKWYPNDLKTIPRDLKITPTILLHWYLGDGSLSKCVAYHRKRGATLYIYKSVKLHTNGFSYADCCFLSEILNDVGLKFKVVKHRTNISKIACVINYQLRLVEPAKNNQIFFAYIGSCPEPIINIYDYKWNWKTEIFNRKNYIRNIKMGTDLSVPINQNFCQ